MGNIYIYIYVYIYVYIYIYISSEEDHIIHAFMQNMGDIEVLANRIVLIVKILNTVRINFSRETPLSLFVFYID